MDSKNVKKISGMHHSERAFFAQTNEEHYNKNTFLVSSIINHPFLQEIWLKFQSTSKEILFSMTNTVLRKTYSWTNGERLFLR